MTVAHIDYETRSRVDLRKTGVTPYASDPSTEIMCMAWAIDDGPVEIWTPALGDFPKQVLEAEEIHAHNASFERVVTREKIGVEIFPKRLRCSMSRATQAGLPRSLAGAAESVGAAEKDDAGRKLMLKMTKPDRKGNWVEDDESMRRLFEYCISDVESERSLESKLPKPTSSMQRTWGLHEVINDRGLPLDREVCEGAVRIMDHAIEVASSEASDLTDEKITSGGQIARISKFIEARGVDIADLAGLRKANLRSETIDAVLEDVKDLDPVSAKLLELRKAVSSAAPKKFRKALDCLCTDDRLRDVYVFPGAHTGRATSFGVQIMNFKKCPRLFGGWNSALEDGDKVRAGKEWENIQRLIDAVGSGDLERLCREFPKQDPVRLLGESVRLMVAAPAGKTFVFADLSQIEMRVAHWLSGNRAMMKMFAAGGDPYVDFASHFFGTHDVTKAQRTHVKPICLAEGSKVLSRRGWINIESVSMQDELWDGEEFVKHEGLIRKCQPKPVINLAGLRLTQDHMILTGRVWRRASDLAGDENMFRHALDTFKEISFCSDTCWGKEAAPISMWSNACAGLGRIWSSGIIGINVALRIATNVVVNLARSGLNMETIRTYARTELHERGCCPELVLPLAGVRTNQINDMKVTAVGESASRKIGFQNRRAEESFSRIFSRCRGTRTRICSWAEKTITKATSGATYGLFLLWRMLEIVVRFEKWKKKSADCAVVYDILNCGPRHRFTALTGKGPVIVKNCLGGQYGLGPDRLIVYAKDMGLEMSFEEAKAIITAYRAKYANIPRLWRALDKAAVQCILDGKRRRVHRVCMGTEREWFYMELPSGRKLWYFKPGVIEGKFGLQVEYFSNRGFRDVTWGGSLTENLAQAITADITNAALIRAEEAGLCPVINQHDEIGIEVDIAGAEDAAKSLVEVLTVQPEWADGLPIAAGAELKPRWLK